MRRLIPITLFLIAGAIVNVAVAWGIATVGPQAPGVTSDKPVPNGQWPRDVPFDWPPPKGYGVESNFGVQVMITYSSINSNTPESVGYGQSLFRYGWPCLAMDLAVQTTIDRAGVRTSYDVALATVPTALRLPNRVHPYIPLRPIWPGFLLNTLFYAAILWALFITPGKVRRVLRRKRRLCPACAYPIGVSSVCSECGQSFARQASSDSSVESFEGPRP